MQLEALDGKDIKALMKESSTDSDLIIITEMIHLNYSEFGIKHHLSIHVYYV